MRTALSLIISGFVATSLLFTSCVKEFSDDAPVEKPYNSTIFVGSEHKVIYAYDANTGERNWEYLAADVMTGAPLILDNAVFITLKNGIILKLDKLTGKVIFEQNLNVPISSLPILHGSSMYLGAGNNIFQINPQNMEFLDTVTISGNVTTSPVVGKIQGLEGDYLFATTNASTIHAINLEDLVNVWSATPGANIGFESAPCLDGDSAIYIGGDDGKLYAINSANGNVKWTFNTGGPIKAAPITAGGNILFGSYDRNFYSVDTRTGLERWKFETDERIYSSAIIHKQNVIFGSYDKNIYCIAIIDGELQWKQTTFGLVKASPILVGDKVYITSFDKIMYCLDANKGGQHWTQNLNYQVDAKYAIDNITSRHYPATSGMYEFK